MAAPLGNNNASKNKPFAEAIERALKKNKKEGREDLDQIASTLITMAVGGDLQAIKEIADRTDGKAKQQIDLGTTTVIFENNYDGK